MTVFAAGAPAPAAIGAQPVQPLAVRAAGVVSAAGMGLDPLRNLLLGGGEVAEPADVPDEDYPSRPMRPVPAFRPADYIGRKGTRNLDRLTGFGLVACRQALDGVGAPATDDDRAGFGVVLGTSTGSIQSVSELARDTLVQERPYLINPAHFPNTVMNSCAGQVAIRNVLRGLNATLAGGHLSSLFAFRHARIALSQGRARSLLVGGVEELTAPAAWAWHRSGTLTEDAPVGEGCAVFAVDGAGAGSPCEAELLACDVGYVAGRGTAEGLAAHIRRALDRSGVRPEEIDVVAPGAVNQIGVERAEERALRSAAVDRPQRLAIAHALGETYSAGGALQLAAVLAHWRADPATAQRYALITSVGRDGNAGALVVRRPVT